MRAEGLESKPGEGESWRVAWGPRSLVSSLHLPASRHLQPVGGCISASGRRLRKKVLAGKGGGSALGAQASRDLPLPGRYDLLFMPPSFPFGGMENPCLTFVTPCLLAGDRSLADVIIHEISHSWFGNLVTNANWGEFWLNEGFTMYAQRRISTVLFGEPAPVWWHWGVGWVAPEAVVRVGEGLKRAWPE